MKKKGTNRRIPKLFFETRKQKHFKYPSDLVPVFLLLRQKFKLAKHTGKESQKKWKNIVRADNQTHRTKKTKSAFTEERKVNNSKWKSSQ